eukprot:TRINITY_DN13814_c0_g1_i1.p1 TRINITY_DN13814_c0_g1~~TRINITY_DN13814_c0_g1_i1.p1  ORF type:complete len:196 (-),score=34.35 TRINITY_DN13814_c0_g1_i1:29-565(-)
MTTPADILKLKGPTQGFLCPLSANTFGIEFLEFQIRDMVGMSTFFHVKRDRDAPMPPPEALDDSSRFIRYDFGSEFLKLRTIGTSLVFSVGKAELRNFLMIERHYFRNRLIKSFEFKFGFCIPGSTNSWEFIYDMPKLSKKEEQEMIDAPYETRSDSFYFADDKLIMHNKAEYAYSKK